MLGQRHRLSDRSAAVRGRVPAGRASLLADRAVARRSLPSVGTLKPAFSPGVSEYTVQVPSWLTRVSLTPTLSQPDGLAQVSAFQTLSGQESPAVPLLPGTTPIPVT